MKKLPKYFFEIIAIFIGITASFMVDEWKQDLENRERLESNLLALKSDLVRDTLNYTQLVEYYDSARRIFYPLFSKEFDGFDSWSHKSIVLNNLGDLGVKIQDNNNTYNTLVALNLFQYLKNDSVLTELNNYYGNWKTLLKNYEKGIRNNLQENADYIVKYTHASELTLAQISGDTSRIKEEIERFNSDFTAILQIQEFRNINVGQMEMYLYMTNLFNRSKEKSKNLIILIDKELE